MRSQDCELPDAALAFGAVKLYAFEAIGEDLTLLPLPARRALDVTGLKLSLQAWQTLELTRRQTVVALGSAPQVDTAQVRELLASATPPAIAQDPISDLTSSTPPAPIVTALGPERPLPAATWSSLSLLDRYALGKVVERGKPERIEAAYREIVGNSALSTHLNPQGEAHMVRVSDKPSSVRRAVAESRVSMNPAAFERLLQANAPKGDVLGTARIAGIMAAKRTSEWIPLCHPLNLSHIRVELEPDPRTHSVRVLGTVEVKAETGVEMEALVAVSAAALTVYDMLKAFDRSMQIGPTQLLAKSGGRSGDYRR